jgi:hypothetical protein
MSKRVAKITDQQMVPNTMHHRLRSRIKTGMAIKKLNDCIEGKVVLDNQQVACIRIALNKCLPDAIQPKDDGTDGMKDVTHVPTWKLLEAIEGEVVDG